PQGLRHQSSGAEPSGTLRLPGSSPHGPAAFRARADRHRPLEAGRGSPVPKNKTMTAHFDHAELLTAAMSSLFLAVPFPVVVAAGVLAVPRRMVSAPGLGIGIGLLAGVVLAAVSIVAGPLGLLRTGVSLASVLGLLCVMAAAVLIVVRREPARPEVVLGTVG